MASGIYFFLLEASICSSIFSFVVEGCFLVIYIYFCDRLLWRYYYGRDLFKDMMYVVWEARNSSNGKWDTSCHYSILYLNRERKFCVLLLLIITVLQLYCNSIRNPFCYWIISCSGSLGCCGKRFSCAWVRYFYRLCYRWAYYCSRIFFE